MQKEKAKWVDPSIKNWLWSDCKLVLRRTNPDNVSQESYQNLQAEVELQSEQIQQPFVPILRLKKNLLFKPNKGFYCKKGVPLPPLVVKLQDNYFELLKEDEEIIMIYCELTIAYPSRKDTHFYLEELRTNGDKKKLFSPSGEVQFSGITLKQYSHQKQDSKFSLLVTICASSIQQNKIILKTLISTAFFTQNSRINRTKFKNSKQVMKLISPTRFIKPICQFNSPNQQLNKEIILRYLRIFNQNAKKLSIKHPLYLLYHFHDILKVYYNSQQVNNLYQLLQTITHCVQTDQRQAKLKTAFVSYSLKKTKKIKKTSEYSECVKRHRQKVVIQEKINHGEALQNKLLMITFQNSIIQIIRNQIQKQKQLNNSNLFQQQLLEQISKLIKIFQKWTHISKNGAWTGKALISRTFYKPIKNTTIIRMHDYLEDLVVSSKLKNKIVLISLMIVGRRSAERNMQANGLTQNWIGTGRILYNQHLSNFLNSEVGLIGNYSYFVRDALMCIFHLSIYFTFNIPYSKFPHIQYTDINHPKHCHVV